MTHHTELPACVRRYAYFTIPTSRLLSLVHFATHADISYIPRFPTNTDNVNTHEIAKIDEPSIVVSNLKTFTKYQFNVFGRNNVGVGVPSIDLYVTTKELGRCFHSQ